MEKEIEKLNQEREKLLKELQDIEQRRSDILTRLIEIQGIIKYLQDKNKINPLNVKEKKE